MWISVKTFAKEHKKWLIPLTAFLVTFLVALFIFAAAIRPAVHEPTAKVHVGAAEEYPSAPLQVGETIEQAFSWTEGEELTGFGVRVATYDRILYDVVLSGELKDLETGEVVAQFSQMFKEVKDNTYLNVEFDHSVLVPSGSGKAIFSVDGISDNDVLVLWISGDRNGVCSIGGQEESGSLMMSLLGTSGFLTSYYWGIALSLCVLLAVLCFLLFVQKAKHQTIFLVAALGFGVIQMFVFPPYGMHDDKSHTEMALYHSAQLFGQTGDYGAFMQRADDTMEGFTNYAATRDQYYYIRTHFFEKEQCPGEYIEAESRLLGRFYQYIPQTLGVTIGRLLHWGRVPTLYLGRFLNLAAYTAVIYLTIRLVPFKTLFTMLGLMPYILMNAASFSYDVSINALALFFIGYVLYLCLEKPCTTWKDLAILAVVGLLLAPLKFIYIPLLLLPLMIPKEKWAKPVWKKVFSFALIAVGIVVVISAVGAAVWASFLKTDTGVTPWMDEEGAYTYSIIYQNFREFVRLMAVTAIDRLSEWFWAIAYIPFTNYPSWFYFSVAALLVLSVSPPKGAENPLRIKRSQKLLMLACAAMVYLGALFVAIEWTPVGSYYIKGAQGRYFLPLFPLVVLAAQGILERPKDNDRALLCTQFCLNAYGVFYMFQNAVANRLIIVDEVLV